MKKEPNATAPRTPRLGLIAAAAFLGAPWIAPALGQAADGRADTREESPRGDDIVRQFARAAVQVQVIGQEHHPQLQTAETDAERVAIRRQASDRMVAAIVREGLSLDAYNQVAAAAKTNPELDNQITRLMDDVR